MPNPLTSGTALVAISALKDKYGYEYFDALGKNKVVVEPRSAALSKLESGECKAVMILEESILKKREEEGSELAVIYPLDGVISIPSPIMTIKKELSAHHNPAPCEVLTDWFLSSEGQSYIVRGWMHSVLKKEPRSPFDSVSMIVLLANAMPVNWPLPLKMSVQKTTPSLVI